MPLYEIDGARPEIAEGAYVAPTATLIGRVRLLAGSSVWWGAVLRGDNDWIELGEGSNIQDNAVCHTDEGVPLTVGAGVTVGHSVILHGCTVGDGALIGMGATLLNHAVIGPRALIGAGALVPERKTIAEAVLAVGSPARVVRDLSDDERASLATAAENYMAKASRYAAGCRAL